MSREKFRAWDDRYQKMYYMDNCDFIIERDGVSVFSEYSSDRIDKSWLLEQFTDIKDKNGDDSYENDFIKFPRYICGTVVEEMVRPIVKHRGSFGVFVQNEYDFHLLSDFSNPVMDSRKYICNYGEVYTEWESLFEIIGNKHQNPELMEG